MSGDDAMEPVFNYGATIVRVIDGDTVDADVDVGFYLTARLRLRFAGINAPELHAHNPKVREAAKRAKAYVQRRIGGMKVVIHTEKTGDFGRWLATIWIDGENLNAELVSKGLAVPYRP